MPTNSKKTATDNEWDMIIRYAFTPLEPVVGERGKPDPYTRIGQEDSFKRYGESILALVFNHVERMFMDIV
jgi:hypothetical protein